jgi:hypothetical protein
MSPLPIALEQALLFLEIKARGLIDHRTKADAAALFSRRIFEGSPGFTLLEDETLEAAKVTALTGAGHVRKKL